MDDSKDMVVEKSWDEFRNSGLLWWINMILHTFGLGDCGRYYRWKGHKCISSKSKISWIRRTK